MERYTGNVDLEGIKRFQVPDVSINMVCPICGEMYDIQLVDQIYYPAENNHIVRWECEECDIEIQRSVTIISVIATFDVDDPKRV